MIVLFINFLPLRGALPSATLGKAKGEGVEKTSSRGNSYFCVRHIKTVRCDRTKETKGTGITKENEKVKGIYPPI